MQEAQNSADSLPDKQDCGRNDLGCHRIPASVFEVRGVRVVVTGSPNNYLMRRFVTDLRALRVTDLVRVCDTTYSTVMLNNAGIVVTDMVFPDGTFPPEPIITRWLDLVRDRSADRPGCGIAVHCQSGLGRSAALAALLMIEMGLPVDETVATLRTKMRGALNVAQLTQLERYVPRSRARLPRSWSVFGIAHRTAQPSVAQPTTQHGSQLADVLKAQASTECSANEQLMPAPSLMSVQPRRARWRTLLCCADLKNSTGQ